jgi:hypothetical protein
MTPNVPNPSGIRAHESRPKAETKPGFGVSGRSPDQGGSDQDDLSEAKGGCGHTPYPAQQLFTVFQKAIFCNSSLFIRYFFSYLH